MRTLWSIRRYMPSWMLSTLRCLTSLKFRKFLRESLGGTFRSIPDTIVSTADGRKFHIGPDPIYWRLYTGEEFEPEATSVIRQLVRPGDTVVDVGANFGWYTTLLHRLVGDTGHVYAFEPVPTIYEQLIKNLSLNQITKGVTVTRTAIGNQCGEVTLHVFDDLPAAHSSISTLGREQYTTFSAPLIDLDKYLTNNMVQSVDFLKCDVEGSELMVFQGANKLLSSESSPIIIVELNSETSAAFDYTPVDIWLLLQQFGYTDFYDVGSTSFCKVYKREHIEKINQLLCCKKGEIDKRMASLTNN